MRHEPTDKEVFDFYGKDAFKTFDNVPTWKRASPHNIQKKTWRNASCNHCHGQRGVFLAESDLLDYEKGANKAVVVPDDKIPAKRAEDTFKAPEVKVKASMLVKAEALHETAREEGARRRGRRAGPGLLQEGAHRGRGPLQRDGRAALPAGQHAESHDDEEPGGAGGALRQPRDRP